MKRLPWLLTIAAFPLAALAAEPSGVASQWVWCQPDAVGQAGAGAPERAELLISGTSLTGRLYLQDKEYARLAGVIKPASRNADGSGAVTAVWDITATETTGDHKRLLKGTYTKHQSADSDAAAPVGSYETLALSAADKDSATVILSRVLPTGPVRVAAR